MWISKERMGTLEKRIADLETQVQSQHKAVEFHLNCHRKESEELKAILNETKATIAREVTNLIQGMTH